VKQFILVIFLATFSTAYSQFENTDIGGRAAALNGAYTSLSDNSLSVFYNPSGLGQMKFREVSFYYSPAPFGLSELSTAAFTYAEPLSFGTLGAGARTYGFDLYRETSFSVSYGNNYRGKIFYGANINLYNLSIKNYNSATSFGFDIGAMAYLTKFLKWGFIGKNLTGSTIGSSKENIAQVYRTGFTIQPRPDVSFILETEKDVKYPFSFRGGFEYSVVEFIDIRAGISSEPTSFSGGIGIYYSLFQLDYSFNNHQDLGFTHQGTLTINFGGLDAKKYSREKLSKSF